MQNCSGVSLSKLTMHLISRCKLWRQIHARDAMLTAAAAAADLPAEALPRQQEWCPQCWNMLSEAATAAIYLTAVVHA